MKIIEGLRYFREKRSIRQKDMLNKDRFVYMRTENGQVNLTMDTFLECLNRLQVTPSEFFTLIDSFNTNQELNIDKQYIKCTNDPKNPEEKEKLLYYYYFLKAISPRNAQQQALFNDIKLSFSDSWEEVEEIDQNDIDNIYQKIENSSYFTYYEYRMVGNTIDKFPIEKIEYFLDKMYPIENLDKRDTNTVHVASILFPNAITAFMVRGNLDLAELYLKKAKALKFNPRNYYFHLSITYLDNLIQYLKLKEREETTETKLKALDYYTKILNIITMVESFGDTLHAELMLTETENMIGNTPHMLLNQQRLVVRDD